MIIISAITGLVKPTELKGNHLYIPVFFEVRSLSNSEKSSLIVPFRLLKRSKAPGGTQEAVTVGTSQLLHIALPSLRPWAMEQWTAEADLSLSFWGRALRARGSSVQG